MSYRVEVSVSGRAGCKTTDCKNANIKIEKGELRVGTWVVIGGNGTWQWRHWGCMTGKMLENMRKYLEGEDNQGSGQFRWDYLDGLEGEAKGDLSGHPELQEKVKRVITQGFVDPEDWRGDPEMNKLGSSGTRTAETKRRQREEKRAAEAVANGDDPAPQSSPPTKSASKKRAKAGDGESEDEKPAKKKRGAKAKKEEDDEEDAEPAKESRTKKVKKEEAEEEDAKPAKKSRAKKVKKEDADEEDAKPTKEARAKNVKKEDAKEEDAKPAKKSRAKKAKKEESVSSSEASSPETDSGEPDFSKLSVAQLKEELGKRGLSKIGKKADLVARLEEGAETGSEPEASDDEAKSEPQIVKKQEEVEEHVKDEPSDAFDMDEIESKPQKAARRKMSAHLARTTTSKATAPKGRRARSDLTN